MAHDEQQEFCSMVRVRFDERFTDCEVLDIGSLDINGNNRYLFYDDFFYIGVDLGEGPNVDIVAEGGAHTADLNTTFDIVISTECLEHDKHYKETLRAMVDWTKRGGIMLFTCATTGRDEHGTARTSKNSSPFTNDYYKNLTQADIEESINLDAFIHYGFEVNKTHNDLNFWGIKK